ncbi:uncharacterized protein F54H12.2-like [Pleurodeles waltl]|uniref:uncharacterized protein F54H12.2-like n=1 Tax=Pleurodeles waltl TaxID=8319 RepID=UPI0037097ACC
MFNQVDITLGDRLITQNDNMYAYRALMESILNYSSDALDTQLSACLFYKDTYAQFENTALDGLNTGFVKRASFASGRREFDLLGRIHSDLFFQDKLIINVIDLKIKLNRNKDAFCLIAEGAEQYKLLRQSASLYVKRVNVSPTAYVEALQLLNAKYAIERVSMKVYSIPVGTRLTQQQNVFLGQPPKLVIIGFVDNTAFSNLHTSNPFNFKHYDFNCSALVHEGAVIPAKPYTPNFGSANFIREYLGLVSITGKHLRDSGVIVSREGYGAGYTLFAFDLTPDMEDGDHYSLVKNGNLKDKIRFSAALTVNVNMVVFAVFDSVIQVNHARQILFNYCKKNIYIHI